jgi:hypothetical protein
VVKVKNSGMMMVLVEAVEAVMVEVRAVLVMVETEDLDNHGMANNLVAVVVVVQVKALQVETEEVEVERAVHLKVEMVRMVQPMEQVEVDHIIILEWEVKVLTV